MTEQGDAGHRPGSQGRPFRQGPDGQLFSWPGEREGVDRVAPSGKADVLAGKRLSLGIRESAFADLRRTLPEDLPGPRPIDRLAVDRQPLPDLAQPLFFRLGYRAVRTWTDVKQERAIFADDVDQ